jgi:hypothetical protein
LDADSQISLADRKGGGLRGGKPVWPSTGLIAEPGLEGFRSGITDSFDEDE